MDGKIRLYSGFTGNFSLHCNFQGMSAAEREKFSNKPSSKSLDFKEPTKYTSFGVTFDEIDRQKEEERKKSQRMNLTIEEMLLTAEDQGCEILCKSTFLIRRVDILFINRLEDTAILLLQHYGIHSDD